MGLNKLMRINALCKNGISANMIIDINNAITPKALSGIALNIA